MRVQSGKGMVLPEMVFPCGMTFAKQHDALTRHLLEYLFRRYDRSGFGVEPATSITADVFHSGLAFISDERGRVAERKCCGQ